METSLSSKLDEQQHLASRRPWDYWTYLQFTLVAALLWLLYWRTLADLALDWWKNPAWSQGMLLPPLAGYIAWMRRDCTLLYPATADNRGLFVIALACVMFLLGQLAAEFFLMRISFVVLMAGLAWTFWGIHRFKTLTFPFVLLATMVPLPVVVYNSVSAPLQLFASDIAARLAQAVGITVYRDGNIIQLASTSLGVAEACSGLNSLAALIVGSLLLGYLLCSGLPARIGLSLLAIPLAISVNILRITGTAILADYNQDFAMGFYHSFSGWLVFIAGFGILYIFAKAMHALLD